MDLELNGNLHNLLLQWQNRGDFRYFIPQSLILQESITLICHNFCLEYSVMESLGRRSHYFSGEIYFY